MPELPDRIIVDPDIMVGKPIIRGTRILEALSVELDVDAVLKEYPRLTTDDIRACLEYAHAVVSGERIYPLDSILSSAT